MIEPHKVLSDGSKLHHLDFPPRPGPVSLDQLTDGDRAELALLAAGCSFIVDVGTYYGGSAEALLNGMPKDGRLVTIDNLAGVSHGPQANWDGPMKSPALSMIYAIGRLVPFTGRFVSMIGDSRLIAGMLPKASADLVFLDAAHDYKNVRTDIEAWLPVVKSGGIIAGHDFDKSVTKDIPIEEIWKRSELDWDQDTGVHWGVVRAVMEAFTNVMLSKRDDSTVWAAQPSWKRQTA